MRPNCSHSGRLDKFGKERRISLVPMIPTVERRNVRRAMVAINSSPAHSSIDQDDPGALGRVSKLRTITDRRASFGCISHSGLCSQGETKRVRKSKGRSDLVPMIPMVDEQIALNELRTISNALTAPRRNLSAPRAPERLFQISF